MTETIWFEYLDGIARIAVDLLRCLLIIILIYIVCVHLLLFKRFLRIRFGKRVQPDGSKAVIVTGATSGLGLGAAKRLYARGFTVFACCYDDRKPGYKELKDLKERAAHGSEEENARELNNHHQRDDKSTALNLTGNHLFLIQMDLRSSESIANSAQEIKQLLDSNQLKLHCLLNNAASCADGPFELLNNENIRDTLETNLVGPLQLTKEFSMRIIKDRGRVVNVSSGIRMVPCPTVTLYGCSKAALSYFSESLDQDLRYYGLRSFKIYPGNITLQTNIAFSRISGFQKAVAQMSNEERELYRNRIAEMTDAGNSFLRTRLAHCSAEDSKKLAELYDFTLPDFDEVRKPSELKMVRRLSLLQKFLAWVMIFADGSSRGDLESNGSNDCYESAVTMVEPPSNTYAGARLYQFYSGPLVEYMPASMVKFNVRLLIDSILLR